VLRNFKQIYEQEKFNKVKNEFRDLNLKNRVKVDDQYMVNLREVTPLKKELIPSNYEQAVVVNRIGHGDSRDEKENLDKDFEFMWQTVLWGGKIPKRETDSSNPYEKKHYQEEITGRCAHGKPKQTNRS